MSKVYFYLLFGFFLVSCNNEILNYIDFKNPIINKVLTDWEKYNAQIILTEISRNSAGKISFEDYNFSVDDELYFYPASTVKLPVTLLTLQYITSLNKSGEKINLDTNFSVFDGQKLLHKKRTLREIIEKIFLISDNEAYNILFHLLGKNYINSELHKKGFLSSFIVHDFSYEIEENLNYIFYLDDGNELIINSKNNSYSTKRKKLKNEIVGNGFVRNDSLISEKFSFRDKNYISLRDLHELTKRVIFKNNYDENEMFFIQDDYHEFILKAMSLNTLDGVQYGYSEPKYWDSYVKFFLFGDSKNKIPENFKIYNKVGLAYGQLTESAYIVDLENNVEFILTCTLRVNENKIYNDGIYEYDSVGIPFLSNLGKSIYLSLKIKNDNDENQID